MPRHVDPSRTKLFGLPMATSSACPTPPLPTLMPAPGLPLRLTDAPAPPAAGWYVDVGGGGAERPVAAGTTPSLSVSRRQHTLAVEP